ncbi:hypothetical protein BsWGS_19579 [Bradybaena similaris]
MEFLFIVALVVGVAELKTVDLNLPGAVQKRSSVCYGNLGCFATDGPFTSPERPDSVVPESPDKILTRFLLYTRESKTVAQSLDPRHPETVGTTWTRFKQRPTKFVVHGFLDNVNISPWMLQMKDELLTHGDYNVVIVDWSGGNLPPYGQASSNCRVVGAQIAAVINQLIKSTEASPSSFHVIGHSLGSHVSGYAGEKVPGLGRITGLDPAGPYFENTDPVVRLDPSDAVFVDTIHSDAKNLLQLGFGMKEAVGHSDFYPNLGHDQPGCTRDPITNIIENGLVQGVEEEAACNHLRSIKFFSESINSQCPFLGFPCNSEDDFQKNLCHSCTSAGCAALGFNSNQHIPPNGQKLKYYLTTADHAPFCRYHLDVTLKLASGQGQAEKGTVSVVVNGDKGSSGKIPLMGDPVDFTPGNAYRFYVMVPTEVGNVHSVTFSWSHSSSLLDPLHWNILGLRHPTLYIAEIDIFREEAGADVHLCSGTQSIETDQSLTVATRC